MKLLTVAEVAADLALSRDQVYLLVKRGELAGVRIGRSVRVDSGDLERFVELRRVVDHEGTSPGQPLPARQQRPVGGAGQPARRNTAHRDEHGQAGGAGRASAAVARDRAGRAADEEAVRRGVPPLVAR